MKKEKAMKTSGEYLAPKIKVKTARARRLICSSITKMTVSDTEQGDEDFNDN